MQNYGKILHCLTIHLYFVCLYDGFTMALETTKDKSLATKKKNLQFCDLAKESSRHLIFKCIRRTLLQNRTDSNDTGKVTDLRTKITSGCSSLTNRVILIKLFINRRRNETNLFWWIFGFCWVGALSILIHLSTCHGKKLSARNIYEPCIVCVTRDHSVCLVYHVNQRHGLVFIHAEICARKT